MHSPDKVQTQKGRKSYEIQRKDCEGERAKSSREQELIDGSIKGSGSDTEVWTSQNKKGWSRREKKIVSRKCFLEGN